MEQHIIPSLAEIKSRRKRARNINILHKESLSALDRLAILINERVGSVGFFLLVSGWTFFWLCWNIFAPHSLKFDPFPAFVLWLFISNVLQLILLPLLLIGQNLQERRAQIRAEADFETNVQAEQEIEVVLQRLEKQEEMISKLLEKHEREHK